MIAVTANVGLLHSEIERACITDKMVGLFNSSRAFHESRLRIYPRCWTSAAIREMSAVVAG